MKYVLSSFLVLLIALTACTTDNTTTEQEKIADELDPTRDEGPVRDTEFKDPEAKSRLGYVNYTKEQFDRDPEKDRVVTMDRSEMADIIARLILRHEAFDEIATLVTGDEVLIAYEKNEMLDENEAADVAKKSAASVMPRYFDIYVSDNNVLIRDIESLHNSTTTDSDYENTIKSIINEMKKSPQGTDE
ncbi:YhcN/YlaJ family sporulation lipoprotein [Ornithinibacillus salinisoli]|uniref:YhcN/YlaJ family sporulation lipoprotein n=1 Tax=Ornithinibacillus salinisoli TaxID=1848459 RepID=A0ABW4VZX5_9BACI